MGATGGEYPSRRLRQHGSHIGTRGRRSPKVPYMARTSASKAGGRWRERPPGHNAANRRNLAMNVSTLEWTVTLVALVALLLTDLLIVGRRPHEPSMKESSLWVAFYVGLAVLFGVWIYLSHGARYGGEFFAGWLTEYSLSVDNLFVFVIIMARFAVPREFQQKVLMIGIVIALIMRGAFIAAGAAVVSRFSWVFYIF